MALPVLLVALDVPMRGVTRAHLFAVPLILEEVDRRALGLAEVDLRGVQQVPAHLHGSKGACSNNDSNDWVCGWVMKPANCK